MTIILKPGSVPLETLETIYRVAVPVRIDPAFHARVEKVAARIAEIAAGDEPVYGINTGFGKLASIRIAAGDVATLQRNLILSHCCGVGDALPENIVRLIMALKLISLGRGASDRLENFLHRRATADQAVVLGHVRIGSAGLGRHRAVREAVGLQRALDYRSQCGQVERFEQIVEGAALGRHDRRVGRAMSGDDDNR